MIDYQSSFFLIFADIFNIFGLDRQNLKNKFFRNSQSSKVSGSGTVFWVSFSLLCYDGELLLGPSLHPRPLWL